MKQYHHQHQQHHLRLLRVAHTQQRPSLVEKHHQYHQSFPSVVLTSSASKSSSSLFCHPKHSKISKIKIFYLLGEPYLFIVLPIKQKLASMAFFSTIPSFFKKKNSRFFQSLEIIHQI